MCHTRIQTDSRMELASGAHESWVMLRLLLVYFWIVIFSCAMWSVDRVELAVASHHKVQVVDKTANSLRQLQSLNIYVHHMSALAHPALCMPTIHFTSTVWLRLCCVSVVLLTHVTSRLSQPRQCSVVVLETIYHMTIMVNVSYNNTNLQ